MQDNGMVQLASANVTSLQGIWDLLLDLPFDILAMQELRIHDLVHWQAQATRAGMQLVVGDPGPDGEYLVGFLVRKGTVCPIPLHTALGAQRFQVATWHFDAGPPMVIANVYGHVTPTPKQQDDLGDAIGTFLDHCEAGGAPP